MTIRTWLLFLMGNRQAILTIAANRQVLWVGLLFVLSAGFAREYDAKSILYEPWYFLVPLAASLASSFLLFVILFWLNQRRSSDHLPPFFFAYQRFLALFWMTAPLAWLYAVPYERFLSLSSAGTANLITLGIVSVWRVVLMVRVGCVLMGYGPFTAFFRVMGFACVFALGASFVSRLLARTPVFMIMAGMPTMLSEADSVAMSIDGSLCCVGFLLMPLLVVLEVSSWFLSTGKTLHWHGPIGGEDLRSSASGGMWALGLASILVWLPILLMTQPQQSLRVHMEHLLKTESLEEGLATLSSCDPKDFPPFWEPPPYVAPLFENPRLLDVMAVIAKHPPAPWVRECYLKKFRICLQARTYRWGVMNEQADKFAAVLLALPEGPELVVQYPEAVEFALRGEKLSAGERARLEKLLEKARERTPEQGRSP